MYFCIQKQTNTNKLIFKVMTKRTIFLTQCYTSCNIRGCVVKYIGYAGLKVTLIEMVKIIKKVSPTATIRLIY